jgi:hypothetical protein
MHKSGVDLPTSLSRFKAVGEEQEARLHYRAVQRTAFSPRPVVAVVRARIVQSTRDAMRAQVAPRVALPSRLGRRLVGGPQA